MLLADRPTTSRWTPSTGRTLLSGQADPRRQEPRPTLRPQDTLRRSQSHSEPDLGSAFDPTRTVARAGTQNSTPGSHSSPIRQTARDCIGDIGMARSCRCRRRPCRPALAGEPPGALRARRHAPPRRPPLLERECGAGCRHAAANARSGAAQVWGACERGGGRGSRRPARRRHRRRTPVAARPPCSRTPADRR